MVRSRKLYAGARVRELRTREKMTQAAFAERLGVSPSYLNQIESNQRPLSAAVVLALAEAFRLDVATLAVDEADRLAADLREALADPLFAEDGPGPQDIRQVANASPAFARAFLALHRAHQRANERLASLDDALTREDRTLSPLPWEEVRDFFHYCDNYIDAVDKVAESFSEASGIGAGGGRDKIAAAAAWLESRHGLRVIFPAESGALRAYDPATRVLSISAAAPVATQAFQLAHQVALIEHEKLLDATLDFARFQSAGAREIAKIGLANYFAGAAILPYGAFQKAARELRHDLQLLAARFSASLEQVAHRLSTLQRPGIKGVPFFFVRVDQAGTITKRHSATQLQFARFGGACPLWNVHQAFETPGRIIRQLAETPEGVRYLCLATDVTKHGGGWRAPTRRYAIGLGCEVKHASGIVYSEGLDLSNDTAYEPIGVSCRICERANCHQRSVPPVEKSLKVDHNRREVIPYRLG